MDELALCQKSVSMLRQSAVQASERLLVQKSLQQTLKSIQVLNDCLAGCTQPQYGRQQYQTEKRLVGHWQMV